MKKTIEVTIGPDRHFSVEAHGFKGSSCHDATRAFEEALGEVQTRRHKVEFFQTETTKNQQKLGQ
jgi:Protein of unknown function (DUF2997)